MAPLRDIRLQNLGDLEFDLSRSIKVKSKGAVRLSIYDFLLVSNSNYMSNSHRLGVRKIFSYLLSLGPNFAPPRPTLTPGRLFSKSNGFLLVSEERPPPKIKLIGLIFFEIFVHRQTDAQMQSNKPCHAKHGRGLKIALWRHSALIETSSLPVLKYRLMHIKKYFTVHTVITIKILEKKSG